MKPSCKGLQCKAMIKLTIEDKVFLQQLNSRVNSVKELTSPSVMQEIAKAAFTITGSQFAFASSGFPTGYSGMSFLAIGN